MYEDNDKDQLHQPEQNDTTPEQGEESINAAMELPEIPVEPTPAGAPAALYNPPRFEPKQKPQGSGGWRRFFAAVALVALSAAVGSGSTYYLMSLDQNRKLPIGYELMEPSDLKAVAQTVAEAGGSVIPAIYKQVAPAVVAIDVVAGQGFWRQQGSGSGFVVDPEGYILTNHHVIEDANRIQVEFVDGTTLPAEVIGVYKARDLAVLKVDPGDRSLVAVKLGDSDEVQVGELAIAIGNPFGQEFTVTAGIVSALDREIVEDVEEGNPISIPGAIQTDAAINPGNSGGPLLNSRGEVIGINTAIDAPIQGNVGLGFAVPINLAKEVLPQLIKGEAVQRAFLGIYMQDMNPQAARLLGIDVRQGVLVMEVQEGTAAEAAGLRSATFDEYDLLKTADVITAVNGKPVANTTDLANAIARQKVGDTITLTVVRGDQELTLTATLGATTAE